MTTIPATSQGHAVTIDQPRDQSSLEGSYGSSLISSALSCAGEFAEDLNICLPAALVPGVKYLWVPVALVVGVIAKVHLTYLALFVLGLLALQLIYINLPERAAIPNTQPSPTNSRETGALLQSPATAPTERRTVQPPTESERTDIGISETDASILQAAAAGNTIEIQHLLDRGVSVNTRQGPTHLTSFQVGTHLTPLMVAANNGHREAVELLLNRQADIDYINQIDGSTALLYAAKKGHTSIVELLVRHGADLYQQNKARATALDLARSSNHVETARTIERLQQQFQLPRIRLLWKAAEEGDNARLLGLLVEHVDINSKDENGVTALRRAAVAGHLECVQSLLLSNAMIDQTTKHDETALMGASQYGHESVVRTFLEYGANVNLLNSTGQSASMIAAQEGHSNIVRLLESHASIRIDWNIPIAQLLARAPTASRAQDSAVVKAAASSRAPH